MSKREISDVIDSALVIALLLIIIIAIAFISYLSIFIALIANNYDLLIKSALISIASSLIILMFYVTVKIYQE